MTVRVRYFAGACAAVGIEEESLPVPHDYTLADLRRELAVRHPRLAPVLQVATLLVDQVAVVDPGARIGGASQVDVLPPFAGG